MTNEEQKELFEFEKPKKRFVGLSKIFPKADLEGKILFTLTLEKLIFVSMGTVMLMVVIYALGVERGRSLSVQISDAPRQSPVDARSQSIPVKPQAAPIGGPSQKPQTATIMPKGEVMATAPGKVKAAHVERPASATLKTEPPVDSSKPYTVAAVTLSGLKFAQAEADRLRKEGFDAYVKKSDPYFVVCIGAYPEKEDSQAQQCLKKIRKLYPDAYFRLR